MNKGGRRGGGSGAERGSLAEQLLAFAAPVLAEGGLAREEPKALHNVLRFVAMAWNLGALEETAGKIVAENTRREIFAQPPGAGAQVLDELVDMLIERKLEDFGADLREVRDIRVHGGTGGDELSVEVIGGTPKDATSNASLGQIERPAQRLPRQFVVNSTHYTSEDGLLLDIPRPARELARYWGAIAAAASAMKATGVVELDIACRKQSGRGRCDGPVSARLGRETAPLEWMCLGCGESGVIEAWRGTVWDHRERARTLKKLAASDRFELVLSPTDLRALERLECLSLASLGVLAAARREAKKWRLVLSRRELEDLAMALSAETIEREMGSAARKVIALEERLYDALGYDETASEAARTAAVLAFRARAHRVLSRSVPRVDGCGTHKLFVELLDVEPAVTRELLVRSDTTLEELHAILQVAFGWTESHLHAFRIGRTRYMNVQQSEEMECERSEAALLRDVLPKRGASLYYDYDFGDNWEHYVKVLEISAPGDHGPLPRCLSGQNAAPPEDVGGAGGYADFLEAMADPTHEEHAAMRRWVERTFDAHAFDLVHTNRLLALLGRWQDDER